MDTKQSLPLANEGLMCIFRRHRLALALLLVATVCSCRESKRPVKARAQPPERSEFPLYTAKPIGNSAVLDFAPPGGSWPSHCRAHQDCPLFAALPRCSADLHVMEAGELGASPPTRVGERLAVRGELVVGDGPGNLGLCTRRCCWGYMTPVFVGRPPRAILLADVQCKGDESRVCCDVPAFGQSVVAVGVLQEARFDATPYGVKWALGGYRVASSWLCVED